ncbi:MAG: prepilin-type N-terminal cleavage/methylation domain-containing protein [Chthoniobacterales bacterium]
MFIARAKTNQPRSRSGFTLLEITLAVAILATMSLAIYRFVEANLTALRVSSEATASDLRYTGLGELLIAQWQSLPVGRGMLLGEPYKFSGRSRDEIRWICDGGPGLLTRYAAGDYTVWLRLQPNNKKADQLDLGFLRKPNDDSLVGNDSWIPLIDNVASLEIRYFDPRINVWIDKWADSVRLPRLVRITVGRNDAAVPWEMIIPLARTPF